MDAITILIIAYNECEWVKFSVESLRMYGDVENISLVVVDNGSSDGLRAWAENQEDFTYVYMDEGRGCYGDVINQVVEALQIETDLLVMEGHYVITPEYLSRMLNALHQSEDIGAVGSVSNGFVGNQKWESATEEYGQAVEAAISMNGTKTKYALGLNSGAILFRKEMLQNVGQFEKNIFASTYVMRDYCFRIIKAGYKMLICENAVLWDMADGDYSLALHYRNWKQDQEIVQKKWNMHYFNDVGNAYILAHIDESIDKEFSVLEIGCDCGATLMAIKNKYPRAGIYGCDLNESAIGIASCFAEATVNNIEVENLPYGQGSFDYIIFGDVLEHLRNPQRTIEYCRGLLKKEGHIIASIPNVMHISVMEQLLRGDFTYTETGLLDKTHIHLFTFNEIVKMFQEAGYELEDMTTSYIDITDKQRRMIDGLLALDDRAQSFMYEAFQYVVKARVVK